MKTYGVVLRIPKQQSIHELITFIFLTLQLIATIHIMYITKLVAMPLNTSHERN